MKINWERFIIGFLVISGGMAMIVASSAWGWDIKPGQEFGLGVLMAAVVIFYFRKNPEPPERHDK